MTNSLCKVCNYVKFSCYKNPIQIHLTLRIYMFPNPPKVNTCKGCMDNVWTYFYLYTNKSMIIFDSEKKTITLGMDLHNVNFYPMQLIL